MTASKEKVNALIKNAHLLSWLNGSFRLAWLLVPFPGSPASQWSVDGFEQLLPKCSEHPGAPMGPRFNKPWPWICWAHAKGGGSRQSPGVVFYLCRSKEKGTWRSQVLVSTPSTSQSCQHFSKRNMHTTCLRTTWSMHYNCGSLNPIIPPPDYLSPKLIIPVGLKLMCSREDFLNSGIQWLCKASHHLWVLK